MACTQHSTLFSPACEIASTTQTNRMLSKKQKTKRMLNNYSKHILEPHNFPVAYDGKYLCRSKFMLRLCTIKIIINSSSPHGDFFFKCVVKMRFIHFDDKVFHLHTHIDEAPCIYTWKNMHEQFNSSATDP